MFKINYLEISRLLAAIVVAVALFAALPGFAATSESLDQQAASANIEYRHVEALALYRKAFELARMQRHARDQHYALLGIAESLQHLGHYREAVKTVEEAFRPGLAPKRDEGTFALRGITQANAYQLAGQYARALPIYERQHPAAYLMGEPGVVSSVAVPYAHLLLSMGRTQQALAVLNRYFDYLVKMGFSTPGIETQDAVVRLLLAQHQPALALTVARALVKTNEKAIEDSAFYVKPPSPELRYARPHDNPEMARAIFLLAEAYAASGDFAQALALHTRAHALREKRLGAEHPHTVESAAALALAKNGRRSPQRAITHLPLSSLQRLARLALELKPDNPAK